jgi:Tfp pilus assembly protein PilX
MNKHMSFHDQRGVTLFVALIMLILITLMVITAFKFTNVNAKSVHNMQVKNEAVAAANVAIEEVIGTSFTDVPSIQTINVDLNNDLTDDYTVTIAKPTCIRASIDTAGAPSSVTLGPTMSSTSNWNTVWELVATVNDTKTGAKTIVNAGVRVLLSQAKKDAVCS